MGDHDPPRPEGAGETSGGPSKWDKYLHFSQQADAMESHRNMLLYNYLLATSILILAWATLYASSDPPKVQRPFFDTFVLLILSLAGGLASFGWAVVACRVSKAFNNLIALTEAAEKAVPGCGEGSLPYLANKAFRKKFPRWIRWASMGVFTRLVPGGFAAVYGVLLIASLGGNPMEWLNQNPGAVQLIAAAILALPILCVGWRLGQLGEIAKSLRDRRDQQAEATQTTEGGNSSPDSSLIATQKETGSHV